MAQNDMARSGIDTLKDHSNWQRLYDLLPESKQCPYFSPGYYQAYRQVEDHPARCFWAYKDESNFLFYPFLIKSINSLGYELPDEYYDVSGAYGYNGPAGVAEDKRFLAKYNQDLISYLQSKEVVTELTRYCPVTGNRALHNYPDQIDVLDNVFVDLSPGLDKVWSGSFSYGVRKAVKKGEQYGLRTAVKAGPQVTKSDIRSFLSIYNGTMKRNEADKFYFFRPEFFEELFPRMGEGALLTITWLNDTPISAEIVLTSGDNAYGFLGGTLSEYFEYKANTYQRWELIKYLAGSGIRSYSMGGGATRGDSIYDFKMSFAKGCVNPFFIGTKIHLPAVYEDILSQWRLKSPSAAKKYFSRLQGYRIMQ